MILRTMHLFEDAVLIRTYPLRNAEILYMLTKAAALGTDYSAPRVALLLLLLPPLTLLPLWGRSISFSQILQPLCFRNFGLHLYDELLQLLLAFLAGVGVDVAGVLFAVGPFGRVATFKQMVVDLGDTSGTGLALAAHIGLEIGYPRLFRFGWGRFLPQRRDGLLRRRLVAASVDVGGGVFADGRIPFFLYTQEMTSRSRSINTLTAGEKG